MRTLSDLTSRGLNGTANALAQSADHIRAFFEMLRAELGFYLGCLNLRDRLTANGRAGLLLRTRLGTGPGQTPAQCPPVRPRPV